jgi:hypothetical protein
MTLRSSTLALALLGSAAFLATPSLAVEPDVDSPVEPELPAPRTDRLDFQQDNQPGALLDPESEGADPRPPSLDLVEPLPPPSEPELAPPPSEPELAPPLVVPEP